MCFNGENRQASLSHELGRCAEIGAGLDYRCRFKLSDKRPKKGLPKWLTVERPAPSGSTIGVHCVFDCAKQLVSK